MLSLLSEPRDLLLVVYFPLVKFVQAPHSDSQAVLGGQTTVLVWTLGYSEALDELVDGLDHASPIVRVRPLHLLDDEFGFSILALKSLRRHQVDYVAESLLEFWVHARRLNLYVVFHNYYRDHYLITRWFLTSN